MPAVAQGGDHVVRGAAPGRNEIVAAPARSRRTPSSRARCTETTTSASARASSSMTAPASAYSASSMKVCWPAPGSTATVYPSPVSFPTSSGTIATRVSPSRVSLATAIFIRCNLGHRGRQGHPSRRVSHVDLGPSTKVDHEPGVALAGGDAVTDLRATGGLHDARRDVAAVEADHPEGAAPRHHRADGEADGAAAGHLGDVALAACARRARRCCRHRPGSGARRPRSARPAPAAPRRPGRGRGRGRRRATGG